MQTDSVASRSSLGTILEDLGPPGWRAPQRRLLVLFVLIILWMLIGRVDRVVTAPGKVVPFDKVKVVQHLEGGIIQEILVRENQTVKAGEPLVQLDLATGGINRGEMKARMASLKLAKLRVEAEAEGLEPVWPAAMLKEFPQIIAAEQATALSKRDEMRSSINAFDSSVLQNRQRVAEARERMTSLEANLAISKKELAVSEELLKDKLTSQLDHFQRQSNVESMLGEIAQLRQSIIGSQAAINESIARRNQEEARFRREAANEIGDYERRIASLTEELSRANEQDDRSVIRAPIDGIVKNLRFQAPGNVVKPGEPMMEIVPLRDQLVIELKLNPADRGYVNLRQEVLVKISTYDFYRYGGLKGQVTGIAADTDTSKNDEQYYRVIVSTDKTWVGDTPGVYPISPGMLGEVDIKVDSQMILWSLLRPVLKLKTEALREI
ncbi:MAG: HlyD family type I secretion periplasmic adaptor subunit [Burkholderiaceae bacterium]|jgi:membrane fusion protein, adhesin transport system|nr:HlyD family type I secretion periplasmic adaptor subunit [Burkholderiaceae bacterium]